MDQFFTKDYHGAPFELFGAGHLAAIAVIVLVCLSFYVLRNRWGERERKRFRLGLAGFIVLAELSWHAWSVYYGTWTIQTNLPLHLCSVFIWLSVVLLLNRSYPLYELVYFLGMGGAIQAVLTPDAGIYGFPHFRAFQTFADHGGIIVAAMYMTVIEGYRPTWASFKRNFLWGNLYMALVFGVNLLIGSNYMQLAHKPDFPTLLDYLAPWPWYIFELELIAFIVMLILYIPWLIKDARDRNAVKARLPDVLEG